MTSPTVLRARGVSRRAFVGGLAAIPYIAGCAPARVSERDADMLVIGGGMAGLAAALTLEEQGQRVALIEADTRLGGRCHTLRTPEGVFDCGATTIGPLYGRVRAFAEQAGVDLVSPHGRHGFSYHLNDVFATPDDWESSAANLLEGEERAIAPQALEFALVQKHNQIETLQDWNAPDMLQYDVPLDAFLAANGVSAEALRLIALTTNTMSMSETSALFQMREFARLALPNKGGDNREVYAAAGRANYNYVADGTSRLIEGMAAQLKGEPSLGDPVAAIDITDGGVQATRASGETIRARAAICTIPYSALGAVAINPALSGDKLNAVSQAAYTKTTHIFCRPKRAYWQDDDAPAGLITDGLVDRMFANKGADGEVEWLDVWLNGANAGALDALPDAERDRAVLDAIAAARPSTKGALEVVGAYSWGQNPYIQGNKQVLAPGQVSTLHPHMATPWARRLRFAGEHTRSIEAGLEAAAATGVQEAVAALDEFAA